MRKRNCNKIFDNILWYVLYLLPVICYCAFVFSFPKHKDDSAEGNIIEYNTVECLKFDKNYFISKTLADKLITHGSSPWFLGIDTTDGYMYYPLLCCDYSYSSNYTQFENVLMLRQDGSYSYKVFNDYEIYLPVGVEWNGGIELYNVHTSSSLEYFDTNFFESFADLTDLISYSIKEIPVINKENGNTSYNFDSFLEQTGLQLVSDNIVSNSLENVFGIEGVLPIFKTNTPIIFFAWFICVYLIHLAVDFILAIPRLCHKWLGHAVDDE